MSSSTQLTRTESLILDECRRTLKQWKIRTCRGMADKTNVPMEHVEAAAVELARKGFGTVVIMGPNDLGYSILTKEALDKFYPGDE